MPVPDFQSIMLPLLQVHADNNEHGSSELISTLASKFKLTDQERGELLTSGFEPKFDNRVGWARTYLKKAGLLESPRRGMTKITPHGSDELALKPQQINVKYLKKYPEFTQFQTLKHGKKAEKAEETSSQTPLERILDAYNDMQEGLVSEVLEKLNKQPDKVFEKTVLEVLRGMGYGGEARGFVIHTGKTGDGGVDGVIGQDPLGLDLIAVQTKQWKNTVNRPEIDSFIGAINGKYTKGVFVTTSTFSPDAYRKAENSKDMKIILIDGRKLAELMVKHNVGVSPVEKFEHKKIDSDFFAED